MPAMPAPAMTTSATRSTPTPMQNSPPIGKVLTSAHSTTKFTKVTKKEGGKSIFVLFVFFVVIDCA